MSYFLRFKYNKKGRGYLTLWCVDTIVAEIEARTGSINKSGELVNAIKPGEWYIKEAPVDTINNAMIWESEGWYAALYTPDGDRTSYGIHPDGGFVKGNGTKGCIGTQGDALIFRDSIRRILNDFGQKEIVLHIQKGD